MGGKTVRWVLRGQDWSGLGNGQVAGFVYTVMNVRILQTFKNFRPTDEILFSQKALRSMKIRS